MSGERLIIWRTFLPLKVSFEFKIDVIPPLCERRSAFEDSIEAASRFGLRLDVGTLIFSALQFDADKHSEGGPKHGNHTCAGRKFSTCVQIFYPPLTSLHTFI